MPNDFDNETIYRNIQISASMWMGKYQIMSFDVANSFYRNFE